MKRTLLPLLLGAASLAGCGGGPTPVAAPPAPASSAAPAPSTTPTAAPARRSPPPELLRYWAFDGGLHLVAYLDVGGLLHTELGRAVVPAVLALAKGALTQDQTLCIQGAADSAKDAILGGGDDGGIVVARFDDTAFHPGPCLTAAGATPATLEGAKEAFTMGDTTVAHLPGVLVLGPAKNVAQALAPRSGPATFPRDVSLGPDEYLRWTAQDEGIQASGTLLASTERFRIGLDADLPPPLAAHIEKEWQERKAEAGQLHLGADEAAILEKLVQAIDLKRDGGHVTAAFDLHEPPVDQARELGAAASLGVFAVRRYIADAKAAEARNAIGQIAKDYATWYETEDGKPRAKKKLMSFPAVPKTVPVGTKYQSSPADWKPWAPLRFSMDAPQYYQYEVRAAKDGNSADIIARGDIDGDGKQSEFKLHIAIDRKKDQLVVDPALQEHDPED